MCREIVDFLYNKRKNHFDRQIKAISIANMYHDDLDKEAVILLQAIINENRYSIEGLTYLLSLIHPMTPHQWLTSNKPMLVFASISMGRKIGDSNNLASIIKPLSSLCVLYKEFDNIGDMVSKISIKSPQKTLYESLCGSKDDSYKKHIGLSRYIPVLSRNKDSAGLGLWNKIDAWELCIPYTSKLISSCIDLGVIDVKSKHKKRDIRKWLMSLDKTDPFKYIPILDDTNPTYQLKKMGYIIGA